MTPGICRSSVERHRLVVLRGLCRVGGDVNDYRSVSTAAAITAHAKITLVGRVQGGYINGWGGEDVRMTDLFSRAAKRSEDFNARPRPARRLPGPLDRAEIKPEHLQPGSVGGPGLWAATAEARLPLPLFLRTRNAGRCVHRRRHGYGYRVVWPNPPWPRGSFINDSADVRRRLA